MKEGILWAAVTRDGTTLAEAGEDNHGGAVLALAKRILDKKPSPGCALRPKATHRWHWHSISVAYRLLAVSQGNSKSLAS